MRNSGLLHYISTLTLKFSMLNIPVELSTGGSESVVYNSISYLGVRKFRGLWRMMPILYISRWWHGATGRQSIIMAHATVPMDKHEAKVQRMFYMGLDKNFDGRKFVIMCRTMSGWNPRQSNDGWHVTFSQF